MRRALRKQDHKRKGAAIVLAAFLMVALFAMVSFAVDLGYIAMVKSQLQVASDSASHAAMLRYFNPTGDISPSDINARKTQAIAEAKKYAAFRKVGSDSLDLKNADIVLGSRSVQSGGGYKYDWTVSSGYNAIRITTSPPASGSTPAGSLGLFFAPIMGFKNVKLSAQSVAVLAPRDIVFVIDLSGSMHHDTEPWALNALNAIGSAADGSGAGDYAMKQVWSDLGITTPYVATKGIESDLSKPGANNLCWKMTGSQNKAFDVPSGVAGSSGGKKALNLDNVCDMIAGAPFCKKNSSSSTIADPALASAWQKYASPSSDSANQRLIKAYDYIIDNVLPNTMPQAKPSLANASNRDNFREYWRGYLNYARGNDSSTVSSDRYGGLISGTTSTYSHGAFSAGAGDGTSGGINSTGFSNPATTMTYKDANGNPYTGSVTNDCNALVNRTDYMTYIQFMMDMSYDGKAGLDSSGNQASSSARKYNPMSENFKSSNGSAYTNYDQARWTDSNGLTRFPREQPMGALIDGVISAIKQVKNDNPTSIPADSRDHISIALFGATAGLWCTPANGTNDNTAPNPASTGSYFTYDYDNAISYVSQLQAEKCVGASTATYDGLMKASKAINNSGRTYSNKVVVLFTDGVPNYGTTVSNVSPDPKVYMNGSNQNYYYTSGSYLANRNSALTGANTLYTAAKTAVVHTVAAGGGRDADVTMRQALRTKGIFMDAGTDPYSYQTQLKSALEDVVQAKVPKLAIISSTDSQVGP